MAFKTRRQYELEDDKKQALRDIKFQRAERSDIKSTRGGKRYFKVPRTKESDKPTQEKKMTPLAQKLRKLTNEGKEMIRQQTVISGSPTPPAGSSGGRKPRDPSRDKRESGGGLTWTKVKSEDKEQAMDQEEDLEELTDGELEEIEKKLDGVKRRIRNLVTTPDVYPSELKNEKQLKEHKERAKEQSKILNEAKDKIKLESRETQAMYKANKVPKKVRPESPSKENNYQTQIDKPIQQRALSEKIRKLKKGHLNQTGGAGEKNKPSEPHLFSTRTGQEGDVLGSTPLGETDGVHTGQGGRQELPMYKHTETSGSLGGKEIPESGGKKTERKITTNSGSATIGGGRTGGDKRFNAGSGKVRGSGKITLEGTRRMMEQVRRDQEAQNNKKDKPTPPPQEDVPESSKTPELSDLARQVRQFDRKPRDKKGKIIKAWEEWLMKYEETKEDKINATKLNEKRAITEGKVRPPTPKHLVKPAWKSWLEKDQGQGDAKYGNPHETGMEDPRVLQTSQDDFSMEEKEEEKDEGNKPYIERNGKTE